MTDREWMRQTYCFDADREADLESRHVEEKRELRHMTDDVSKNAANYDMSALRKRIDEIALECPEEGSTETFALCHALIAAVDGLEWVKENGRYDSATHARTTLTELSRILGVEGEK